VTTLVDYLVLKTGIYKGFMKSFSSDIQIAFIHCKEAVSDHILLSFLNQLPTEFSEYILKFQRPIDRTLSSLGYALVLHLSRSYDIDVKQLKKTPYGRPYFVGFSGDFNISRTQGHIIAAISSSHPIGIDIEYFQPLEIENFQTQCTDKEWNALQNAPSPLNFFYRLWTRKEALVKLDGRGLDICLTEIDVLQDLVEWEKSECHLHTMMLKESCCVSIASHQPLSLPTMIEYQVSHVLAGC
jgi:4'-phosphopantetheinyl transferase